MMTEVDIGRQVRAGTGGNDGLLEMDGFHGLVATDFQPVLVDKCGTAVDKVYPVTGIELSAQLHLFANHLLGVLQYPRKREPARFTNVPEHLVGVEGDDLLDRVTQRLGRNGAPVGAVTANRRLVFNDGDAPVVLRRIHCRPFSRRTGANNHHVVMMLCHARTDSLSTL